jgi:hypothetical protein
MSTPSLELSTLAPPAPQPGVLVTVERDRLIRRAKTLSWVSLAYMTAEGAVAITATILAGSVALLGFGLELRDRRPGFNHCHLALHRHQAALWGRRVTFTAARRDHLLSARPLYRPGRDPHADRRRASRHHAATAKTTAARLSTRLRNASPDVRR